MNVINQKLNYCNLFFFALLANFIGYTAFLFIGDFSDTLNYFLTLIPIYMGYFIIVFISLKRTDFKNLELFLILFSGFLIRLILVNTDPVLSTDMYRFLWDGKILANGINPYIVLPGAQQLEGLSDFQIYPLLNSKELYSTQAPLSQLLFLISYFIGYKIIVWKIILLIFESAAVIFLFKLIDYFEMSNLRIAIFYLNPIVIIETYSSGHLQIIGVCFLIIAIYYFYKSKFWRMLIAIILTALIKYNSLIIALPFLYKKFFKNISLIFISIFLTLILFSTNGGCPFAGWLLEINHTEYNGFLFKLFVYIFNFDLKEWFTYTLNSKTEVAFISGAVYYKISAFLVLIIIIFDQMKKLKITADFRGVNYLLSAFIICAAMLILSPEMYPRYLIWIIPFLLFLPNWSWLFFTFIVQIFYFGLQNDSNGWFESPWILMVQYIPFYCLLLFEYFDKRKVKGWFL